MAGCAYNAPVGVSPNLNVYLSYGDKLPGRYAVYVNADSFNTTVRPTGLNCGAHNYPLDLRESFKASALATVRQLVGDAELVESPLPATELARRGLTGQISVQADTIVARVQVISGFWSSTADSTIELTAGMNVDTGTGRVLGTTAQGFGNAQNDAGSFCGQVAVAIGSATEKAVRQVLGQLGERLSNSERLRHAAAIPEPQPPAVAAPTSGITQGAVISPSRSATPSPVRQVAAKPAQGKAPRKRCSVSSPDLPDAVTC